MALILPLVAFAPHDARAQTPDGWNWSGTLASNRVEFATAIATDSAHNSVYTAGYVEQGFSGILGGLWALLFGANTQSDGYLLKQALNGTVQWQIVLGGSGDDACTGVCVDDAGNVYVTGYFSGSGASFTGASGSNQNMSATGGKDIFVVCYNANGALQWKMKAGGTSDDMGNCIRHANGNLIVGGSFKEAPTIAGMATSASAVAVANRSHGFVVALQASNGAGLWRVDGTNGENSSINAVATDGSTVLALGVHKGSPYTFQNSSGSLNTALTTASGNLSADILALNSDGSLKWKQAVANPGSDQINALGLAISSTAVYISGSSFNNSIFPGNITVAGIGNPTDYGYIARLNKANGNTIWVRTFSGPTSQAQVGRALQTDIHGDVVLAGTYKQSILLPDSTTLFGLADLQVFLSKFSGSGILKWTLNPSGAGDDIPYDVALDGSGGVYMAGSYKRNIAFNVNYTDDPSQNLFNAKLHDLDFDVAAFRDPSEFNAPLALCETDPPVDLSGWLVPEAMGTGKSVFYSVGIIASGSDGPTGALGLASDGLATFNDAGDQVVIDLVDTIPAGEPVILRWRSVGGAAAMNVQGSLLGASGFTDLGNQNTTSTSWVLSPVTATAPMRFIKLTRAGTATCQVDGVFYNLGSYTDGTWSGTGVSGSTFDPAGLNGNVDINYASYGHSTTHTIAISPLPVAGSLTGGLVCPGAPFTATLQGQSGGSIAWVASTDNQGSWVSVGSNSATITLPSVTDTTQIKAIVTSPPCPASISNTVTVTPGDTTPPILDPCPADIVVNVQDPANCGASVIYTAPQAHNSCGTALVVTRTNGPASGSLFPFGTTTVQHSTTQASHTATCSFTVTVIDQAPPDFSVGATPTLYLDANGQATIPDLYPLLGSVTDCSGVGVHAQVPAAGTAVDSNTEVIVHVADVLNNDTAISFILPVVDTLPPTIACATIAPVEMALGQCGVVVTIPGPTYADNTGWTALDSAGSLFSGALFPVGSHPVTYTVTDPSGLTASCTSTVVITVAAVPPLAYPSGTLCQTSAPMDPVNAYPAGGQFQSDPVGLALDANTGTIDPQASAPGSYTVTLLYSGPCEVTRSTTVAIEAPVDAGADATLTLCSTDAPLPLLPLLGPDADAGGAWTLDGVATDSILDPATDTSGTYSYTVTGGPACGNAEASVMVTVNTTPSAAWTAPAPVCSTAPPMDMGNTVTGASGGSWSGTGMVPGSDVFDPSLIAAQGAINSYTLTYSVTVDGCTATHADSVTVVTAPVAYAGADAPVCGLDQPLAAGLSMGTGLWSTPPGISVSGLQDPNATAHASAPGAYALVWTATNGQCSDADTVLVTFDLPSEITAFDAGVDQEQNIIRTVELHGVADGATEILWSFLTGSGQILQPGQAATEVHNLSIGTNALMLSARIGVCPFETDTVLITIHDLFIPSGFSPNGDGVNDTFVVTGLDVLTDNGLTVFDRWGQQVYHMKGYANQWDGHGDNGRELLDGTYFYVLNFTGGQAYHGTIIIKR